MKLGIGLGLNFRIMKLNSNFQHLKKSDFLQSYKNSERRFLFLDYEVNFILMKGTMLSCGDEYDKTNPTHKPSQRIIKLLTALANDKKNLVFIVTGREKKNISDWFDSIKL
jgi:trehalose 6-phosphate synthase/phosphatase